MAGTELRRRARGDEDTGGGTGGGKADAGPGYTLTCGVVAHHNRANDAWVTYKGGVYDVTTFLASHPGGGSVMLPYLGGDVTDALAGGGDGGAQHEHSAYALKMLERYRIGTLSGGAADGNVDGDSGEVLVRWDRPILHQVGMLGGKYSTWIHSFPTTDHSVKMFTNDALENLTKCAWYVPLVVWIPVVCAELAHFVHLSGGAGAVNKGLFAAGALAGAISWLLFEYTLHRYVFHWETRGYWQNIVHFLLHGHHHITPMDFDRLVFPPVPALLIGGPFWYGAPRVLGVAAGYPWLFGFVGGYLVYDMTHFWIHHGVPRDPFLRAQKRRHVHHHYFKPSVNFGISNPLFDVVFGTLAEPGRD